MTLAPIVLFVYNRPEHTRKTLEALQRNDFASQSVLYIYADGAKENASDRQLQAITATRAVIKEQKWCGEVHIIESELNKGLAAAVIQGVTEVIEEHGKVIVLEDDIVTEKGFLEFMNNSLEMYKGEDRVFGVSGYKFDSLESIKQPTYFLPVMSSWGYGIWADRWAKIDFNTKRLNQNVYDKSFRYKMKFGTFDFYKMLQQQVAGEIDSWAVRFYTSMMLQKGLFLFPKKSLLTNIGLDGTGVHCESANSMDQGVLSELMIFKIPVHVDTSILKTFNVPSKKLPFTFYRFKQKIKSKIAPELIELFRRKKVKIKADKFEELRKVPRFVETRFDLNGTEIIVPDAASFLFMYKEIFDQEIYKFTTDNKSPYIIDGGANIGLASIYFKQLYPNAEILAFEPDKGIYEILKNNVQHLKNISLINIGLWNEEKELTFFSEGADGGLIEESKKNKGRYEVIKVESLRPFLNRTVDFLKLDIEGAEFTVLKDIRDCLHNVQHIFVEYHSFVEDEQSLPELLAILKEAGFRLHVNSPGLSSVQPFIHLNVYNMMDMQLNIYGYRNKYN